MKGDNELNIT